MNDETNKNSQPQQINVIVKSDVSNAIGIASFVFGIISIFFLAPIFVPLAVLLGIIAIVKKQLVWGILGLVSAFFGFITSPILMGFFGLMTAAINIPNIQTPSTGTTSSVPKSYKSVQFEFQPTGIDPTEIVVRSLETRDYRIEIFPGEPFYYIRCITGGQLKFAFRSNDYTNPVTDPKRGNLILRGADTMMQYAAGDGGVVRVGEDKKIIISFRFGPVFGNKDVDPDCRNFLKPQPVKILFTKDE